MAWTWPYPPARGLATARMLLGGDDHCLGFMDLYAAGKMPIQG